MLKAKLDSVRKNKKGFSLVELIIVIAIMVALIAVMAPAFVKYVQKARDSALATAAEDFYQTVQTYYGDPDCTDVAPASASITIEVENKHLKIASTTTGFATQLANIIAVANPDTTKQMGETKRLYTINITNNNGDVKITMPPFTTKS